MFLSLGNIAMLLAVLNVSSGAYIEHIPSECIPRVFGVIFLCKQAYRLVLYVYLWCL